MPRGGARPGAGRKKGSGARTVALPSDLNQPLLEPLDLMLAVMRHPDIPAAMRFEAAKQALPYRHPKLAPLPAPKGDDDATPADDGWGDDLAPTAPH